MSDNSDAAHDSVDRFLNYAADLPVPKQSRQALLLQTQRLLGRRRLRKRLVTIAAMAACYMTGVATVLGLVRSPANDPVVEVVQLPNKPVDSARDRGEAKSIAAPTVLPVQDDPDVPPALLEHIAARSLERRTALYRTAGDRYLLDLGDVNSALRCYRRALDSGREQDLKIESEDNWLLIALKQARQKETNHAVNGS